MEIRKLTCSKQISKTLIVAEALRMAFTEFDSKKSLGKLYGNIVNYKAIKYCVFGLNANSTHRNL